MYGLIVDNKWLHFDGIMPDTEKLFDKHFSVKHQNARYLDTNAGWDGYFRKYSTKQQRINRTFLKEVTELCAKNNIPFDVIDKRPEAVYKPNISIVKRSMLDGISLTDYQLLAIYSAYKNEHGIIVASTGAGKTEICAAIVKMYDCPTVIIADIRVVIKQLYERLKLRNIDDTGLFYGGSTPNGNKIIVGSVQSFAKPPLSLLETNRAQYMSRLNRSNEFHEAVKNAELLIVDECDKSTNKMYKDLFNTFGGRYKFGLSATPFDEDKPVNNLVVRENFGPIIYEVDRQSVQATGRIIPIKYISLAFGEEGTVKNKTAFDIAERELVVENPKFHEAVAKIVKSFPDDGTLIIVDTNNVELLGLNLEAIIPNSKFIYGKTSKSQRDKYVKAFEKRELKCLIGSKIMKRGFDLSAGTENLIICGAGKLGSNFTQIIGRAVRNNKRGWARVFGFFFLNNHYLYSHSRKQLKTIVNMGYESKVVFSNSIVDGKKFVESRFRRPK